jgi:hypothetical protein
MLDITINVGATPGAYTAGQWTLVDVPSVGGNTLSLTVLSNPDDGGLPLTRLLYRVDGGSPVVTALTEADVQIAAENAAGMSPWSDIKSRTPTALPIESSIYIDDPATLAMRNALVAAHDVGNGEKGFTGFTDYTGWTEYVATNANELRTHLLAGASSPLTKKRITCNWNGVSSFSSGQTIAGPSTSDLSGYVNPAKDVGYDTPPHYTKIVAGVGYTPIVGGASGGSANVSLELLGFGWVEVDGVGFDKALRILPSPPTYPIPPIVAVRNGSFPYDLYLKGCRTGHIVGNVFDGPTTQCNLAVEYGRFWDNEIKSKTKEGDFVRGAPYNLSFMSSWKPRLWFSGNIAHSYDGSFSSSTNHSDFFQSAFANELHSEIYKLFEFNILNCNCMGSQAIFGDDSNQPTNGIPHLKNHVLVHNNIINVNAYHGVLMQDPSGAGELRYYRNHVLSATRAVQTGNTNGRLGVGQSAWAVLPPPSGIYVIRENYANSISAQGTLDAYVALVNNRLVTNDPGTYYVRTLFDGNGTWGTSANGFNTYSDPGFGLSKSAAKTAIRNFWRPVNGYRTDGFGCIDPNSWPAPGAAW